MRRFRLWLAERLLPSEFAVTLRGPTLRVVDAGTLNMTSTGVWDGE